MSANESKESAVTDKCETCGNPPASYACVMNHEQPGEGAPAAKEPTLCPVCKIYNSHARDGGPCLGCDAAAKEPASDVRRWDITRDEADVTVDYVLASDHDALLAARDARIAGLEKALAFIYEQANEAMYAEYSGPHIGQIQDTCKALLASKAGEKT